MDLETGWTVYPEEGNFPAVARALLAAADHPNQVRSVSHPRAGFHVPDDVFERFTQADRTDPVGPMKALGPERLVESAQEETVAQEPRKRRGGRVRKEPLLSPEELAAAVAAGTPDPDASKEE